MESTSVPLTSTTTQSTSTMIRVTVVTRTEGLASSTTTVHGFSSVAPSSEVPAPSSNVSTSETATPSSAAVPTSAATITRVVSRNGMAVLSLLLLLILTYLNNYCISVDRVLMFNFTSCN
jgi:hypothetical protein